MDISRHVSARSGAARSSASMSPATLALSSTPAAIRSSSGEPTRSHARSNARTTRMSGFGSSRTIAYRSPASRPLPSSTSSSARYVSSRRVPPTDSRARACRGVSFHERHERKLAGLGRLVAPALLGRTSCGGARATRAGRIVVSPKEPHPKVWAGASGPRTTRARGVRTPAPAPRLPGADRAAQAARRRSSSA